MLDRMIFLKLGLVGRDTNKQVSIIQPKGSSRKSTEVMEAQRRGTKQGRWIRVGFQEEVMYKLMFGK